MFDDHDIDEAPRLPGMDWLKDEEDYDRVAQFYEQMFGLPIDMIVPVERAARLYLDQWSIISENYHLADLDVHQKVVTLTFRNERLATIRVRGFALDGAHGEITLTLTPGKPPT